DFESAVLPGDLDSEDEDEESKPPTATNVPGGAAPGCGAIPRGWKVWEREGFQVEREGVYVLEGVGFLWVFGGGGGGAGGNGVVGNQGVAKVDTGLGVAGNGGGGLSRGGSGLVVGVGGGEKKSAMNLVEEGAAAVVVPAAAVSQKPDAEFERWMAVEWAKEVAVARGHGKVECLDGNSILINKLWISLGIPCALLSNPLTTSELSLDVWERGKEQDRLYTAASTDASSVPATPHQPDISYLFKDPAPYFHESKTYPNPYHPHTGVTLYKAVETNITRCFEYIEIERDSIHKGLLTNNAVFFLDARERVFVWVGGKCEGWDKVNCLLLGQLFLIKQQRPLGTPVTGLVEMGENEDFAGYFCKEE
ncbi:hypothetical protein HDU98_007811, partial [Podochytrium sp. JEL0797]